MDADKLPGHVLLDLWHVNGPTFVGDTWGEEPGGWVFGSGFPVQTPEATMLQLVAAPLDNAARSRIAWGKRRGDRPVTGCRHPELP
ncbi:hypothetical protein [Microbacterium jejuense]|uniref:hypothetical protein n=1 Tax=Microbacterium jejuense TaxID=1263637 RepID=UPI0031E8E04F